MSKAVLKISIINDDDNCWHSPKATFCANRHKTEKNTDQKSSRKKQEINISVSDFKRLSFETINI